MKVEEKLGFDKVRAAISDRCSTDYAAGRVAAEQFSSDPAEIRRRLLLTDEMRLILMFEERFPTSGYIDGLPFLKGLEAEGSCIDVLSLGKLKTLTDTARRIIAFFVSIKDGVYPNLQRMAAPVNVYPEVQRRIEGILDKYGEIKDSASPALSAIRKEISGKEASLSKRAATVLARAQGDGIVDTDASLTVRDGKYLIPVNSAAKRKLAGYVYAQSATGKTSFVEPVEIIELENELAELHFAEEREIQRILADFTEFLRPYLPELLDTAAFIGEVDFLMAKARTALDYIAGMPVISDDGSLHLRKARHPLLEKALRKEGKIIVPQTVTLSPEKHILVISGPNAGGKSVCLKTTGLLQYMFQWGMLIPTSETSELPVFKRIMLSIGDDQSLENDLSTYSSFLQDMKAMLKEADSQTLVLIDEFGSGTEPAAGGAIAEAILSELDKRGVYGVITTHYTNLKLYASGSDTGAQNGAMLFDAARIEPLFQLEIGLPGNSFAFEMARKTGLPEYVVKDAENRAGEEFVGIERNLRRIVRNRRALDEKLKKVKDSDKALSDLTERYEKELNEIKDRRRRILEDAQREAEDIVKGAGKQVERTIREIKESQADRQKTKDAREELQGFLGAIAQKKTQDEYIERKLAKLNGRRHGGKNGHGPARNSVPKEAEHKAEALKVGEKVRVKDNGVVGEVCKVSNRSVTLIVGNITSTMSPDRVERISSNEFKEATKRTFSKPRVQADPSLALHRLNFKPELDVRGERLNDALNIVMHYIDDAIMVGVPSVRIIHGKGTGALHEEIQKYLRTVPGIKSVSDEDVRHGGSGVTLVGFD